MAGLTAFGQTRFIGSFDPNNNREPNPIRIPLLVTKPATPKNLTFSATGGLKDEPLSLEKTKDGTEFVCRPSAKTFGDNGAAGQFLISNDANELIDLIPYVVNSTNRFEISPSKLAFVWDQSTKSYKASAMLRIQSGNQSMNSNPHVDVALLAARTKVKITPLGSTGAIYRMVVEVFPENAEPFLDGDVPSKSNITIQTKGGRTDQELLVEFFQ